MKIYVAGPMRGYALSNFPAFDSLTSWLRAQGHVVFNPADHDREMGLTGEQAEECVTPEMFHEMFRWDLGKVAESGIVVFLPGWERSKGACVERAVAFYLGTPCYNALPRAEGVWNLTLQEPMQEPLIPWVPKCASSV